MKKRNQNSRAAGRETPATTPLPSSGPISPRRKWLFRFAALVLPLFALVLLEGILRLAGYGYATSFFREISVGGEKRLVNNDSFSMRFFPREVARFPGPVQLSTKKGLGVYRIFILGESAAMGDPEPAYGAGRYLEMLLRERLPEAKIEIVNVAFTAINSHVILPIAREVARHEGDLWIIYMGNNEMVGPYGPATVFGAQTPPRSLIRLGLALQTTRTGQALMVLARKLRGTNREAASWGGMEMFAKNRVPPKDHRREIVRRQFEQNLHDILNEGLSSGAKIILNTVAVNLQDCAPFASASNSMSASVGRNSWDKLYAGAAANEEASRFPETIGKLKEALKLTPDHAEAHFRLGRCLARSGDPPAAAEQFQLACDQDALPFRADSKLNAVVREEAGQWPGSGVVLLDAAAILATNSAVGVCGRESFFEHVHLNFDGNYRLARLWGDQVLRWLPGSATNHAAEAWPDQSTCERRLGISDWNRSFVIQAVMRRIQQPPLSDLCNHATELTALQEEERRLRSRMTGTNASAARPEFEKELARSPADHYLIESYADFLEAVGDKRAAAEQWKRARELWPADFLSHFQLGRLLARLGNAGEAELSLRAALDLRPSLAEGWEELANIHAGQAQFKVALAEYDRACRLRPQEASYHAYRGKVLSKLDRHSEAIAALREAIRLRGGYWEAHLLLGDELAAVGAAEQARKSYGEVVRLNPGNAVAHVNLGVMAAKEQRLDEALSEFDAALRIEPNNATALDFRNRVQAFKNRGNSPR